MLSVPIKMLLSPQAISFEAMYELLIFSVKGRKQDHGRCIISGCDIHFTFFKKLFFTIDVSHGCDILGLLVI